MMPPVKEPLAGLALLVIFGILIWHNRPIESSPPFDPYPQRQAPRISGDTYEAWLWKDPFGFDPAAASGGAFEAQKEWDRVIKGKKPDKKSEGPVQGYTICQDQIQDRLKRILDLDKQLKEGEKRNSVNNEGDKKKPVILAPLVKVTPDTVENKEMRTRQRYAVVAGLIESGYRPQEPDRLHFCSIQEDSREYAMRWEHYRHESKDSSKDSSKGNPEDKPDIVVAWIDSEILTAEDKFPPGHKCTPSCNFPFKNLVKEVSKDNEFYLFDLNDILDQDRSTSIRDHIECIRTSRSDKRCVEKIRLIKPAGREGETGNQNLAKKLADEMELRCIKDPSELIIVTEHGLDNSTELADSLTKFLGISFEKKESDKPKCNNASHAMGAGKIRNVFYLKGLDGNPKKTGNQDKKDKNENQSADKPEHVSVIDLHQPPPLPVGPGQMDYFHRLAEEIRNVHDTVDFDKRDSGTKAVVILGSDFNDKLLIIEALREKMPHLLILTTDLDAQMLYPKHWRSTRNLVVASHFDLLLRKKTKEDENCKGHFWQCAYQDQFPPFRDSHQTNIFYRTLAIAEGKASNIDESKNTFPRVFEVGRNGFVRLGDAEKNAEEQNNDRDYHPFDSTQENTANRLWLLLGIALALIYLYWAIRPWSGILSGHFAIGTVGIFAIAYGFGTDVFDKDGLREPISFTDGVSLWSTILIQLIAILWVIALFFRAMCELEVNFCRLGRWYFQESSFTACPDDNEPDECEPWLKKRLYSSRPWSSGAHSPRGRLTFVILVVTVAFYILNDVYPSSPFFYFWPCFLLLFLSAIFYFRVIEDWEHVSIGRWMKKNDSCPHPTSQHRNSRTRFSLGRLCFFFHFSNRSASSLHQENYESGLWREYYDHGRFGPRVFRVVAMWLIFAIVETLLIYLLPPWPLPCRGSTCGWASWTGVLSFTVTTLLLFFIFDAVRLNFYWIKKLRKQHPLLGERITQEDIDAYNRATGTCPVESLEKIVSMVATRTQAVDRLIYYPMLGIMLMLFAKITYFDNQELPLSKALTFGVAISVLFFSGFMLRHEANQLKLSIKKRVQDLGKKYAKEKTAKQTVKRIDAIDEGAFQPMLEQPVMQALLIILASIGLFAGEYLKLFG